jgi:hypothetical protein
MKVVKILGIVIVAYVAIVVAFESLIGYFQPAGESVLVITTIEPDGSSKDRVVSRLESAGQLYVAANHWPRAWYNRALANPDVAATFDGGQKPYLAVPVTGAEHDRVQSDNPLPFAFRVLTGFPPRYFVRLDPR